MANTYALLAAIVFTYLINLPFGMWRSRAKIRGDKLSWFLAIHAPVPAVFAARMLAGAGIYMIPLFVASFFLGQYTGGLLEITKPAPCKRIGGTNCNIVE